MIADEEENWREMFESLCTAVLAGAVRRERDASREDSLSTYRGMTSIQREERRVGWKANRRIMYDGVKDRR